MDRDAQLALIGRFYDDMWNRFDKTLFPEILDRSIRFRGSLGQIKTGFEEMGDYVDYIQEFAPDFHNEVVSTITEGSQTFARLSYTGTHQGEIFGVSPTNRPFQYTGAVVFTFGERLITEVWVLGDIYRLLSQLNPENE